MTQRTHTPTAPVARQHRPELVTGAALIIGALLFLPSGLLHPEPDLGGGGLQQIYQMVTDPRWIPSAALQLAAFGCFAVAFSRLTDLPGSLGRVVKWAAFSSAAVALGGLVYLFGAVGAEPLSRNEANWFAIVMFVTHILINPAWGVFVAVVAVLGGRSRQLGNRVTMVVGLVGGACWTVAMLTAPYLDIDDVVFPVAGLLLTVWSLTLGAMLLRKRR